MEKFLFVLGISFACLSCELVSPSDPEPSPTDIWIHAYLASWQHKTPATADSLPLPTSEIDWYAFTHLSYFALTIEKDGSLAPFKPYQTLQEIEKQIDHVVAEAHNADIPVLLSIGGWKSGNNFNVAVSEVRKNLISNLISMMKSHNMDGIDLNIEPITNEDVPHYETFVNELYNALEPLSTPLLNKPLLTAATQWQPDMFSRIHIKFDQINVMTYNYSGPWEGWVTWHNAPIYNGGHTFPVENTPLPSADTDADRFIESGIPKKKLGIGIDFYGYVWTGGVNAPLQSWSSPPVVQADVPYHEIMEKLYHPDYYRWNDTAKAAYLSIDKPDSADDKFVSYEEEKAIVAKIDYIRNKGLGGAIIWELSGGYRKNGSPLEQDLLLQTVKQALKDDK